MKILSKIILLAILFMPAIASAAVINNLYTSAISSVAITDATSAVDVSGTIAIKEIDISNTAAVAQTISIYSNAISSNTTESTLMYVFSVPAATGTYTIPAFSGLSTVWSSLADVISVKNIAIKTNAAAASVATMNIKYWK